MTKLKVGDLAPEFKGKNQNGETISLKDFQGKKIVLYFYPKDNTSGCSAESCNLRDNYNELKIRGYEIIGISKDTEKSHLGFIEKYELPFSLIADIDKKMIDDFGVWGEKSMYGKKFEGIIRTTFVISENGIIEKIISKVDTKNHAAQII